jgi:hypothetical protein
LNVNGLNFIITYLLTNRYFTFCVRFGRIQSAGESLPVFQKLKIMMRRILSFLFLFCYAALLHGQTIPAPVRLRCDFLLHTSLVKTGGIKTTIPLRVAVDQQSHYQFASVVSPQPVFNWELDPSVKQQSAYRILLASSPALLSQNKADYWDSKKANSNATRAVYSGKPLVSGNIYYWKVQCWDQQSQNTSFSQTASFYYNGPAAADEFSHHPQSAAIEEPVSFHQKKNGDCFFDFGKDGFAQLQLHLTSNKSGSVWIEAGELTESPEQILPSKGNIRYIKKGLYVQKGTHDYTIVWPVNEKRNSRNPAQMPAYIGEVFPFRYVSLLNFDGKIDQHTVKRKIIFYPFDEQASYFHSSDSVLNRVWDLCRYTIKATSFTGYYIDGDRERLPYEADALINQLSHYAVDAEYSIARRSMAYLLYHPTWPTEWSLQNIMLAWNDYLYTGDDAFLKTYYSELQKKILMPLAREDGLISTRTGKQTDAFLTSIHMMKDFDGKHGLKDNVDWPQKGDYIGPEKEYGGETDGFVYTDYNAVVNAYYYHCLQLMQKIAGLLGKTGDGKMYGEKAEQLQHSFQKVFYNLATRLIKDGDTTLHSSLHANMFALVFGLVPEAAKPTVVNFIKTRKMACSVYGAQFLLEALYNAGEGNYALSLMNATTQRSWYNMLRVGSTITMEAWDKLYKPNLDLNHAWGSAPANIIVRKLMGIEPLTPGFGTFLVKPQIGNLRFATLKTTCIKGAITISWQRNSNSDSIILTVPGASVANVKLAYDPQKPILLVDGKKQTFEPVDGFFVLNGIEAGKHRFVMMRE